MRRFYGGASQVTAAYGAPITTYVQPTERLPGSIMSKTNTGGAGRGGFEGDVIGGVVFHGKKQYYARGADYHYHRGMAAGDSTLEALLFRRVMRITAGSFFFIPSKSTSLLLRSGPRQLLLIISSCSLPLTVQTRGDSIRQLSLRTTSPS